MRLASDDLWTTSSDCTRCTIVVTDFLGHLPSIDLEQARLTQTQLCTLSPDFGPCSEPLEGECPEHSTLCVWTAPPSPPPPPPSPPPGPPTHPKVHLDATGFFGEVHVYTINNGSSSSIAEFVAAEAMRGSEQSTSMLYLAFLSSLTTCMLIAFWICCLSCFRCVAEHWKIYQITTRGSAALRNADGADDEPSASSSTPAFELPTVSTQRFWVLLCCKGCAIVSALVLLCAPRTSAWDDEMAAAQEAAEARRRRNSLEHAEEGEAAGRIKSHRVRSDEEEAGRKRTVLQVAFARRAAVRVPPQQEQLAVDDEEETLEETDVEETDDESETAPAPTPAPWPTLGPTARLGQAAAAQQQAQHDREEPMVQRAQPQAQQQATQQTEWSWLPMLNQLPQLPQLPRLAPPPGDVPKAAVAAASVETGAPPTWDSAGTEELEDASEEEGEEEEEESEESEEEEAPHEAAPAARDTNPENAQEEEEEEGEEEGEEEEGEGEEEEEEEEEEAEEEDGEEDEEEEGGDDDDEEEDDDDDDGEEEEDDDGEEDEEEEGEEDDEGESEASEVAATQAVVATF